MTQVASKKKKKERTKPKLVKPSPLRVTLSLTHSLSLSLSDYCRGKGRWKDTTKSLEPSLGKFSKGVLKLTQKDISSVKTKNKRTKGGSK